MDALFRKEEPTVGPSSQRRLPARSLSVMTGRSGGGSFGDMAALSDQLHEWDLQAEVEEQLETLVQRAKSFGSGPGDWQSFRDAKGRDAITAALEADGDPQEARQEILMQRLAQQVDRRQQRKAQLRANKHCVSNSGAACGRDATAGIDLWPLPTLGPARVRRDTSFKAPSTMMRAPSIMMVRSPSVAARHMAREPSLSLRATHANAFALELAGLTDGDAGVASPTSPSVRHPGPAALHPRRGAPQLTVSTSAASPTGSSTWASLFEPSPGRSPSSVQHGRRSSSFVAPTAMVASPQDSMTTRQAPGVDALPSPSGRAPAQFGRRRTVAASTELPL